MKKRTKPVFNGAEIAAMFVYLCSISAALMYVLCKDYAFVCTVIMTAVSSGIYYLFYALRRKKWFSLLAFIVVFLLVNGFCNAVGSPYVSPTLMEFVFGASSFFNPMFAAAAILMFSLITGFSICYFSAYLPRPCFLLLPAFIPLIFAARTMGGLPLGLLAFLAVGYLLAALGVSVPEYPSDNVYVNDKKARSERLAAIGVIGACAAALVIVIPRSDYTPLRRYLESFLKDQKSIYGTRTLSDFMTGSQPNPGNNQPSEDALFLAATDYPRNVERWSYDLYTAGKGWTYDDDYSTGFSDWENRRRLLNYNDLIRKLKSAADDGRLAEYKSEIDKLSAATNNTAKMTIRVIDGSDTAVVMHPARTFGVQINGYDGDVYRNEKNELFTKNHFGRNAVYVLDYYTEQPNESFIQMLETVDFKELLAAAYDENVIDSATYGEFNFAGNCAEEYHEDTRVSGQTDAVKALADEITAGLDNDYEKALAIERWFGEAGFVYDMDFVPQKPTAEYFMFESRRGICTDFATASTLLLRAAGIPARYTEGFVLKPDSMDMYGRYVVKASQAHAYSTAFIEGYGWLDVDGTRYAEVSVSDGRTAVILSAAVGTAAVLLVLFFIFRRRISEAIFAVVFRLKGKKGRIRSLYLKTRKLACGIADIEPKSTTAEEVRDIISRTLSLEKEAAEITDAANELIYGSGSPQTDEKQLYRNYKAICRMKRSRKK